MTALTRQNKTTERARCYGELQRGSHRQKLDLNLHGLTLGWLTMGRVLHCQGDEHLLGVLGVLRIGQGHGYPLQAKASLGSLATLITALIADMGRAKGRLGGQAVLSQYAQGGRLGSIAV